MKLLLICVFLILAPNIWADEDNDEGEQFGKGKAIEEIRNKGEEFKLSKESFQTLGIVLADVSISHKKNQVTIAKSSLVKYMDVNGVYIYRSGWYMLLKLKILRETKKNYEVSIPGIKASDKIVIKNVGLIRVAHVHASGGLRGVDLD